MLLLSRVADNLYWMSRYLERAEHTARLLNVHLTLMLDQFPDAAGLRWQRMIAALCLEPDEVPAIEPESIARALICDPAHMCSIYSTISASRECARQIRDRISSEMWEQLNILYFESKSARFEEIWHGGSTDFLERIAQGSHLFEGTTRSTISHDEGFFFIELGRHLERALMTIALLYSYREFYDNVGSAESTTPGAGLDHVALLKCANAFEAYCRVYTADLRRRYILEFLLLNSSFPHSVRFAVDRVAEALNAVGALYPGRDTGRTSRLAGKLQAELMYNTVDDFLDEGLEKSLARLRRQCEAIHTAVYTVFINYAHDKELTAG